MAKYLIDMPVFNLKKPVFFETFNWPPSPKASNVKPDGN